MRLQRLEDFGVEFRAIISCDWFGQVPRQLGQKKKRINISLNIYGFENLAEKVGDIIAAVSGYLQHPAYLEPGLEYKNPHYFYLDDTMTDLRHLVVPIRQDGRSRLVTQGIEDALESLESLDPRSLYRQYDVESQIEKLLANTRLKRHQIEGIRFILQRENPDLCRKEEQDLTALVDPLLTSELSVPCLGGILADAMGLGKTLTMLAAILCSRDATSKSNGFENGNCDFVSSGPTLVVLPLWQVLDIWDLETTRHFCEGTVKVGYFHGDGRTKKSQDLISYEIILTTYHTLAADWKRLRVLQDMHAHCIRNQSTQLFKAAENLRSDRRWCLTGTPIQNSLHDLRSLLKFLRHSPFSSPKSFEKYIIEPLRGDLEDSTNFRNLQILLASTCLRRKDTSLNLPQLVTETVTLILTKEENERYQAILTDCQAEFERRSCSQQGGKRFSILFSTIVRLRRLCNHGTFLRTSKISYPTPPGQKLDRMDLDPTYDDESCEVCDGTEGDLLDMLQGYKECPVCNRELGVGGELLATNSPKDESSYDKTSPVPPLSGSRDSRHSSKLRAVSSKVVDLYRESGSKSLVFTSWRDTLDILASMFVEQGIASRRIDGRINALDRSKIISEFQADSNIAVLLMTIDSCAVGLTLTNANFVHLVEPHWNPALEAQAIGRAYRIGQTRTVTVIKYIMDKTVEQRIVELQCRKNRLAKFSLDDTTSDDLAGGLDDLRFVLDTTP
ncbi:hypothetical protein H072_7602 [Dactylellina haptotyla CBS 200.50]|uniref:Helicase C-terminal domain-containing protein n=1 Tax=Dactylellina haptotyla (strain CBS 200.50) TaxID=1284197 RepID=S8A6J8_DACHA|nr:hypothetical protein H072_7602 [Dactylellina haptotyla CBS 200.50]